ncbi:uncharacterized protein LOC129806388 [Phlebotomus papatasi]|uniref:uncharacterized protein LOC129806388 n=1 Tax=Phlebotomus papatasi TaxID=29031 RepID=UPI00248379B1|nr:uncharacterized protein LOC129806388 [Phlebotomus papatasi]
MNRNRKNQSEMAERILYLEEENRRLNQLNSTLKREITDLRNIVQEFLVESTKTQSELFAYFIKDLNKPPDSTYLFHRLPASQFCPGDTPHPNFTNRMAALNERDEDEIKVDSD